MSASRRALVLAVGAMLLVAMMASAAFAQTIPLIS